MQTYLRCFCLFCRCNTEESVCRYGFTPNTAQHDSSMMLYQDQNQQGFLSGDLTKVLPQNIIPVCWNDRHS